MTSINLKQQSSTRFRLLADEHHCVGPEGHCFLFGGAAAAAAARSMELACSAHLTIMNTHFYRSIPFGSELVIDVGIPKMGRQLQRASAVGLVDDKVVFQSLGTLSRELSQSTEVWITPSPHAVQPEDCAPWSGFPTQDKRGRLLERLDIRWASDAQADREGGSALWVKAGAGDPLDIVQWSLFGDLLPGGIGYSIGRPGGGASLDNQLRVFATPETEWVLCEMQTLAANSEFAHGEMRLFSADGLLLATASQSLQVL